MIGLGITFPTRANAALETARAEQARAQALYDQAQRRLQSTVASAWASARAARVRFEALDGEARPAATDAAEMTRIGYQEGRLDIFRLLEAERVLSEIERERADAYRDWGVAFADLERLAPPELP